MERFSREKKTLSSDDQLTGSEKLLPIRDVLGTRVLLKAYAESLIKANLGNAALAELEAPTIAGSSSFELRARCSLLKLNLQELMGEVPSRSARTMRRQVLIDLFASVPYYVASSPTIQPTIRAVRVEVKSPLRIDLAMGGYLGLAAMDDCGDGKGSFVLCEYRWGSADPLHCGSD